MLTIFSAILLLLFSAILSSLAYGLQSVSVRELKRQASTGSHDAQNILELKSKGYKLFATLVLVDAVANTAFIVLLADIIEPAYAIAIGSTVIILFGEIIPRSVGYSWTIRVGSELAPILEKLMWLFTPVVAPLGRFLDGIFGDRAKTVEDRNELLDLVDSSSKDQRSEISNSDHESVKRILLFNSKRVNEVMTSANKARLLRADQEINIELLDELHALGQNYFPVYSQTAGGDIVGVAHLTELAGLFENNQVSAAMNENLTYLHHMDSLSSAIDAFVKTKNTYYVVVDGSGGIVGYISIEEVLDHALGDVLEDFEDYDSLTATSRKN